MLTVEYNKETYAALKNYAYGSAVPTIKKLCLAIYAKMADPSLSSRLSVSQRKLALYIFCGLSLQSISIFLGTDLRNIYVYKSRLKSLISKSDAPRKEKYLDYFS